jgi:hypothetical protein
MEERLYLYYFEGLKDPIYIQATHRQEARSILLSRTLPQEYSTQEIVGESTMALLVGVTKMMRQGRPCVWMGRQASPTGWVDTETKQPA